MYGSLRLRPDQESAVWLFVGPPRSGKSYHAVSVILRWVKCGGQVVTNIPFDRRVEGVSVVSDAELSPSRLCETVENFRGRSGSSGVLVVIDEASIHWDSREWSKVGGEVRGWLATVGHRGVTLVVVGQSVGMIDPTIRRLGRFLVEHSDGTGGFVGLFTSDVRRWTLYEGMDESWGTVRERGWFVVGPGLPYKSADVYRGNVVSGFGVRFFGVLVLVLVVYLSVVYGARYAVVLRQMFGGISHLVGGEVGARSSPVDPFSDTVRVCGFVEGGVLVENSSGGFHVVRCSWPEERVGEVVTLRELLGWRFDSGKFADVKRKK